jgi:hypothetical protein
MAGTLEVTEELCWMPAGWVFDTVLEYMATVLHPQAPALAARLLAARTEANGGYLDLRDSDPDTLMLLVHAADKAYGRLKGERAQGDAASAFAEGLLTQVQQLCDLLHAGQQARMAQR